MNCPHCGKEIGEKTFILHWLSSGNETIKGLDIADAFRKTGYGGGAMGALDYWEEVKEN